MKTMKTIKTIAEQTGITIEREIYCESGAFLIHVSKFGNMYHSIVINIGGNIVESGPFEAVIDDIITALNQYCPLTAKKPR